MDKSRSVLTDQYVFKDIEDCFKDVSQIGKEAVIDKSISTHSWKNNYVNFLDCCKIHHLCLHFFANLT